MVACVALLRGINVGGHNKVAMGDLRRLCEALGHHDVRTYVQSGNVVFASEEDDTAAVAEGMRRRLEADLGVSSTVVVRTAEELASVAADNPYREAADADPTKVHVAFLPGPGAPSTPELDPEDYAPEQLAVGDRVYYLHLPGGIGRSRLAADLARRPEGADATVRNWRTVTRLLAMAAPDAA